jgi:ribulose-phosphate 3-epimerase
MKVRISASLMCADPLRLEEAIRQLEDAGCDLFHIDIMDGRFVPNLAMNFETVRRIKQISRVPLDVHLMVEQPEQYLDQAIDAGSDIITCHAESTRSPIRLLEKIRQNNVQAGLAVNPFTALHQLRYLVDYLDLLLLMTVEPGFAGQKFIASMHAKIGEARSLVGGINLAVDGNISIGNALAALEAGANILVAGTSAIFKKGGSLAQNLRQFRESLDYGRSGR